MVNNPMISNDDVVLIAAGYQPQLRRKLGLFSSFAVSFSFMSILMGIFANYGYVLIHAGPFGIWTWLLVGFGQFMVALVFAEMAGRLPLTGSIYNWTTRLTNPQLGWFTAWIMLFAYAIGTVGVVAAAMTPLQSLLGITLSTNSIRLIGVVIILMQVVINVYGVSLASWINKLAVTAELIAIAVFGLLLISVLCIHGDAQPQLLTTIPATPTPYWPAFLSACLLGAWTIFGFETAADLSEETINVQQITPRSIITAVLASVILGFVFLVIITLAIPDLATVTTASDPVSAIVLFHLGPVMTKAFLLLVVIAMFAASLLGITTASRLLFAVARDGRMIGAKYLSKISSHAIPATAVWLVAAIEIVTFLLAKDLTDLYAAPVVLLGLGYLITVLSFIFGRHKLPAINGFSLGRWHWPIVMLSIISLISLIGILTIPAEFHNVAKIAAIVLVLGTAIFAITRLLPAHRQVFNNKADL